MDWALVAFVLVRDRLVATVACDFISSSPSLSLVVVSASDSTSVTLADVFRFWNFPVLLLGLLGALSFSPDFFGQSLDRCPCILQPKHRPSLFKRLTSLGDSFCP